LATSTPDEWQAKIVSISEGIKKVIGRGQGISTLDGTTVRQKLLIGNFLAWVLIAG
jgi:hypothetical protein